MSSSSDQEARAGKELPGANWRCPDDIRASDIDESAAGLPNCPPPLILRAHGP